MLFMYMQYYHQCYIHNLRHEARDRDANKVRGNLKHFIGIEAAHWALSCMRSISKALS